MLHMVNSYRLRIAPFQLGFRNGGDFNGQRHIKGLNLNVITQSLLRYCSSVPVVWVSVA